MIQCLSLTFIQCLPWKIKRILSPSLTSSCLLNNEINHPCHVFVYERKCQSVCQVNKCVDESEEGIRITHVQDTSRNAWLPEHSSGIVDIRLKCLHNIRPSFLRKRTWIDPTGVRVWKVACLPQVVLLGPSNYLFPMRMWECNCQAVISPMGRMGSNKKHSVTQKDK